MSYNDELASTLRSINDTVSRMSMRHENEDCSEANERVRQQLKRGYLVTYFARGENGEILTFRTDKNTSNRVYYHTVCITRVGHLKLVIDLTKKDVQIMNYMAYINYLKGLNGWNMDLYVCRGDVGQDYMFKTGVIPNSRKC